MKYIVILLALCISLPTLGAYGGGKLSSIPSKLEKDFCPKGDFSKSYYDNSCGVVNKIVVTKAKAKINSLIYKNKFDPIQLFIIQERARDKYNTSTNPYHKAIAQYIIERVAQVF